ncbi:ATP-binding cassette subfamily B protein [Micromonospora sp. Llam0]|uniref:ABC transporter ATP-binding protein n=1 Tax=Micromonospora sp. Llam0 TaxID=2485143 RepID=UPI000F464B58|nr:ABC transporter ATP-binding protein [Micromonospora sp. Llam0]ROO60481.1 ATP-binding cassette subfamily B protein [Micromonospora sp. Llam0]
MQVTDEQSGAVADSTIDAAQVRRQAKTAGESLNSLLRPVAGSIRFAIGMQLVASVATIAPYVAIAELGKLFLADGPVEAGRVWLVVGLVTGALGLRVLFGGGALVVTHFADARMQAVLRRRITAHLGRVPLGWFTRNSSGLVRKATQNDINDLHYLVAHGAVETTAALTVPLVGLVYLVVLDWRLALLGICTLPVYAIAYAVMARGMTAKMIEMDRGIAAISATIIEFVAGISVVKTFGQAGKAHERYRKAATGFGEAYTAWVQPMLRTDAITSIALSAPVVLLVTLAGGTWLMSADQVGPVDVLTAGLVAMTLPTAIVTVSYGMQARREAAAAAQRIVDLLNTPVLPLAAHPRDPADATVAFEDVSFSYDGTTTVLDDISLRLPIGSVTALVGPSGSGKSTLATLLPRFHDVTSGRVSVGGVDVRELSQRALYERVGFVLQDVQLLRLSVADNIRLARPDASLDQVRAAAQAAQIDARILELPRGYDSVIGDDAQLSGGEAQRVSIARAILADPPILVLDEATAYADPESEAAIQDALSRLTGGRTLLVIAHRLGSIVGADQIAVLSAGRLVELGTHPELVAAQGEYARMWQIYTSASAATGNAAATTSTGGQR